MIAFDRIDGTDGADLELFHCDVRVDLRTATLGSMAKALNIGAVVNQND